MHITEVWFVHICNYNYFAYRIIKSRTLSLLKLSSVPNKIIFSLNLKLWTLLQWSRINPSNLFQNSFTCWHLHIQYYYFLSLSNPKGGRECDVWPHTPSTAFWHLPPRKNVINQRLEFGLAPVWYLRVDIRFCFLISSLVFSFCFLPSPLALSVMSFFLLMVHSPAFSPQKILTFFADCSKREIFVQLVEQPGDDSL